MTSWLRGEVYGGKNVGSQLVVANGSKDGTSTTRWTRSPRSKVEVVLLNFLHFQHRAHPSCWILSEAAISPSASSTSFSLPWLRCFLASLAAKRRKG